VLAKSEDSTPQEAKPAAEYIPEPVASTSDPHILSKLRLSAVLSSHYLPSKRTIPKDISTPKFWMHCSSLPYPSDMTNKVTA
jgi:hypothetical protein